ncbi:MAG TPA: hypothetical protein VF268_15800, partial [Gammaproteobacteria bacterium]
DGGSAEIAGANFLRAGSTRRKTKIKINTSYVVSAVPRSIEIFLSSTSGSYIGFLNPIMITCRQLFVLDFNFVFLSVISVSSVVR